MNEIPATVIQGMATIEVWRDDSGLWIKQAPDSLGEGEATVHIALHAVPELLRAIFEKTGKRHV